MLYLKPLEPCDTYARALGYPFIILKMIFGYYPKMTLNKFLTFKSLVTLNAVQGTLMLWP